ncbi:MAG: hypothetical protein JNM17_01095 [Archangium sp.]|nr:hypothetical protein [Archangium sp.]
MWRALLLLASVPAIPRNCDPPPETPAYECRALPAELDLGEVETFTRKTRLLGLDNRDRLELSPVSEPFDVRQTIQFQSLALAVDFTPRDAKLHVQELKVRLNPECEEQTIRLVGLGSGALETPSAELDFGVTPRAQRVERIVPLTNTRRTPLSVSGFTQGAHRIEIIPSQFTLEPAQRVDVVVRLTCGTSGFVTDSLEFQAGAQTIHFLVNGMCE